MKKKYRLIYLISLSFVAFACGSSPVGSNDTQAFTANNPPATPDPNGIKTVIPRTTVDEISEAFAKDKARFAELCSGKTIGITGEFVSIDDNKDESLAVVKSGVTGATVQVIFKNFKTDRFYEMEEGKKVVVQGKCQTTPDGFIIKGINILAAREDVQKSNENQNALNENRNTPKKQ